jgi:hypothetical protein
VIQWLAEPGGINSDYRSNKENAMAESKRIHWSPEQKLAIAIAAMEYQRIYSDLRKVSVIQAVRAGQAVLDPSLRRNNLNSAADVPWIDEYFELAKQVLEIEKQKAEQQFLPNFPAVSPPKTHQEPPEQPASASIAPAFDVRSMELEQLTSVWLERFFDEYIAPRIGKLADAMVATKLADMIEKVQVSRGNAGRLHIVTPETVKRELRPKVLILGLLGNQETIVKTKFAKHLDLTLVRSDHTHDGLIDLAKSHDMGIVMTRFVSHSMQSQVKSNAPHTIFVSGATSDLINILNSLINQGTGRVIQHNFSKKTFEA